jgi:hypothetical protein
MDGSDFGRHGRGDRGGVRGQFMLPWSFSEEAAAEKHMAQLQHNMWVTASRMAVLSIITGGGKWVEMTIPADPLYQHLLLTAEKKFWRCAGFEAVRIVCRPLPFRRQLYHPLRFATISSVTFCELISNPG